MRFLEVFPADGRYRGDKALIYSSQDRLKTGHVVSLPLRGRMASGFVLGGAPKPSFVAKPIKALLSQKPLPGHCLKLAYWLKNYYGCSLGEALRQFTPTKPAARKPAVAGEIAVAQDLQMDM